MNFLQFYETLVLRDIMFYFLPGGATLFGVGAIFWIQASNNIKNTILTYLPSETWLAVVLFLAISYVFGHILYMLHNRIYGRMKSLRRDKIMAGYLEIGKDDKDVPLFLALTDCVARQDSPSKRQKQASFQANCPDRQNH